MQITNISGTFNYATDLDMSHIEVSNRSLESIDLVNEKDYNLILYLIIYLHL